MGFTHWFSAPTTPSIKKPIGSFRGPRPTFPLKKKNGFQHFMDDGLTAPKIGPGVPCGACLSLGFPYPRELGDFSLSKGRLKSPRKNGGSYFSLIWRQAFTRIPVGQTETMKNLQVLGLDAKLETFYRAIQCALQSEKNTPKLFWYFLKSKDYYVCPQRRHCFGKVFTLNNSRGLFF